MDSVDTDMVYSSNAYIQAYPGLVSSVYCMYLQNEYICNLSKVHLVMTIAHFIVPVDIKRPSILGGKASFSSFSHTIALYLILSLSKSICQIHQHFAAFRHLPEL